MNIFSDTDVLDLRDKWSRGVLNVRDAANFYDCSPETIRRLVRGETHRRVGGVTAKKEDRRYGMFQREALESGARQEQDVAASAQRLKELLAIPEKQQTEADHTRRSMPPDPFAMGGIDDPGEDKVLV